MKLTQRIFSQSKLAICLTAALAFTGCDSDSQDQGAVSGNSVSVTGVVIDGYLARATVFVDADNDGTREAGEPYAFTDDDGYYSFNEKTGVDYCAATATEQEQQYCLKTNQTYNDAVIRIYGGYDLSTGEPFVGQLSRRVGSLEEGSLPEVTITPLTSLLTNVDESEKSALLTALDITEEELDVDYFNTDETTADTVNPKLLNVALKVHKVVSVMSDRLTDTYDEIGNDFGTPNDATASLYTSLAATLISENNDNGGSLDDTLSDETLLTEVLNGAENSLISIYESKDIDLPSRDNTSLNAVITRATQITTVINNLIDKDATSFSLDNAKGASKAVEVLVRKTVDEEGSDASLDNAVTLFSTSSTDRDAVITNLSDDTGDVGALIHNDFTNTADAIAQSKISDDVVPFKNLAGTRLKISDDAINDDNDLVDNEFQFYLVGNSNETNGELLLCAKFIDGATRDSSGNVTLGEFNTRGELVKGFWSLVSPNAEGESYGVIITLEYGNTEYSAVLKTRGVNEYQFDFGGELESFTSENTFEPLDENEAAPANNDACQLLLGSRVGPTGETPTSGEAYPITTTLENDPNNDQPASVVNFMVTSPTNFSSPPASFDLTTSLFYIRITSGVATLQ